MPKQWLIKTKTLCPAQSKYKRWMKKMGRQGWEVQSEAKARWPFVVVTWRKQNPKWRGADTASELAG